MPDILLKPRNVETYLAKRDAGLDLGLPPNATVVLTLRQVVRARCATEARWWRSKKLESFALEAERSGGIIPKVAR